MIAKYHVFTMQDYDNDVVEDEDSDYVDIPIKVVTQPDVPVSWPYFAGLP